MTGQNPDNADALVQLGLARIALGELEAAETALQDALRIAPDYSDARIALARIAYFRGDRARARDLLAGLEENPEAIQLAGRIEAAEVAEAPAPWRMDVFYGRSQLGAGLDDWQEAGISLGRTVRPGQVLGGSIHYARRFGEEDIYAEIRLDRSLGERGAGYLSLGGAPDAVFRPRVQAELGWRGPACRDGACLQPRLQLRTADYASGTVHTVQPGADLVLDGDRFRLGGGWVWLRDERGETLNGWTARAEWQARPSTRLILRYADAPETTAGITTDVRAASLAARLRISDRTGFGLALTQEDRPAYTRTQLLVSTNWRF